MQPDYMKMAQAQSASQEKQTPTPATEEQMAEITSGFEEAGMPSGTDAESAKQRILFVFEEAGVLEDLEPQVLQQLTQKIEEFVKLAEAGDMQAVENHPISQMLQQVLSGQAAGEGAQAEPQAAPQAAPQQPAAPTNFASMVKPPGGGMSGR